MSGWPATFEPATHNSLMYTLWFPAQPNDPMSLIRLFVMKRGEVPLTGYNPPNGTWGLAYLADV
jgi:hypothetical protein